MGGGRRDMGEGCSSVSERTEWSEGGREIRERERSGVKKKKNGCNGLD